MKGEQGLTIVELLITTAITVLIVGVLGTATYQIVATTYYSNDKLIAMHELQNVAHQLTIDGQGASAASGGDELALSFPDDSQVTYTMVGTELHRTAGESQITLARNISDISFSVASGIITMTITSSPGNPNISEQRTYKIYLRPAGGEQ